MPEPRDPMAKKPRPANYQEILGQLSGKPLLMKLLQLPVREIAEGRREAPPELADWKKEDFDALFEELGYKEGESE